MQMTISAEEYARRLLAELQDLRSIHLIAVERAAEAMAQRVLQGARLFIVDDNSGLVSEVLGRAGGLMMIQRLPTTDLEGAGIASPDILVACSRRAENVSMSVLARDARQRGAYVVAICPTSQGDDPLSLPRWASMHLSVPKDEGVFKTSDGNGVCPISGAVACVVLWMLTAAFIERMHTRGKTPHLWRSIKLPDTKPFNEKGLEATAREGY
jgi:uncharacterized phosphosugar-binding protein